MKSIYRLTILFSFLFAINATAQKVSGFEYLMNFEGDYKEWGIEKDGKIYAQKGYSFYVIEDDFYIILPSDPVAAEVVINSINKVPAFGKMIFGEEYISYRKKRKKKKKPKKPKEPNEPKDPTLKGFKAVCFSVANCNGNCGAVLVNGVFATCTGNCCGPGNSIDPWGKREPSSPGTPGGTIGL